MQMGAEEAEGTYEFITTRQIGRWTLVGSTDTNRPVIEDSYRRVLDILRRVFNEQPTSPPDRHVWYQRGTHRYRTPQNRAIRRRYPLFHSLYTTISQVPRLPILISPVAPRNGGRGLS